MWRWASSRAARPLPANAPNLRSLGSVYYEPLWVFYRGPEIHDFGGLNGKRLAIGPEESGARALALQLLAVNATVMPPTALLPESGQKANEMLLQGKLDAVFIVGPPESPLVEQLVVAQRASGCSASSVRKPIRGAFPT